jgi:hypothetical protein
MIGKTVRKNGTCKTCGDGAIFDATRGDDGRPTWQCRCCLGHTPRRVYKSAKRNAIYATLNKWFADRGLA